MKKRCLLIRFLALFVTVGLLLPPRPFLPPALADGALRNLSPAENGGLEEEISRSLGRSAGLEEAVKELTMQEWLAKEDTPRVQLAEPDGRWVLRLQPGVALRIPKRQWSRVHLIMGMDWSTGIPIPIALRGPILLDSIPLGREVFLGRGPLTPHEGVSRKHIRLFRTEEWVEVRDLGSTNGTYLLEDDLREPPPLPPDMDVLQPGETVVLARGQKEEVRFFVTANHPVWIQVGGITFLLRTSSKKGFLTLVGSGMLGTTRLAPGEVYPQLASVGVEVEHSPIADGSAVTVRLRKNGDVDEVSVVGVQAGLEETVDLLRRAEQGDAAAMGRLAKGVIPGLPDRLIGEKDETRMAALQDITRLASSGKKVHGAIHGALLERNVIRDIARNLEHSSSPKVRFAAAEAAVVLAQFKVFQEGIRSHIIPALDRVLDGGNAGAWPVAQRAIADLARHEALHVTLFKHGVIQKLARRLGGSRPARATAVEAIIALAPFYAFRVDIQRYVIPNLVLYRDSNASAEVRSDAEKALADLAQSGFGEEPEAGAGAEAVEVTLKDWQAANPERVRIDGRRALSIEPPAAVLIPEETWDRVRLIIGRDPETGKHLAMIKFAAGSLSHQEAQILGRSVDSELTPGGLQHPGISDWHVELLRRGGFVRVRDLGSQSGTYLLEEDLGILPPRPKGWPVLKLGQSAALERGKRTRFLLTANNARITIGGAEFLLRRSRGEPGSLHLVAPPGAKSGRLAPGEEHVLPGGLTIRHHPVQGGFVVVMRLRLRAKAQEARVEGVQAGLEEGEAEKEGDSVDTAVFQSGQPLDIRNWISDPEVLDGEPAFQLPRYELSIPLDGVALFLGAGASGLRIGLGNGEVATLAGQDAGSLELRQGTRVQPIVPGVSVVVTGQSPAEDLLSVTLDAATGSLVLMSLQSKRRAHLFFGEVRSIQQLLGPMPNQDEEIYGPTAIVLEGGHRVDVAAMRQKGPRTEQMDVYLVAPLVWNGQTLGCVFAWADGMGSMPRGKEAAELAVAGVVERLSNAGLLTLLEGYSRLSEPEQILLHDNIQGRLDRAVLETHEKVAQRNIDDLENVLSGVDDPAKVELGTTLDVALLAGPYLFVAHVGDGRVYLLRGGGALSLLTSDDNRAWRRASVRLVRLGMTAADLSLLDRAGFARPQREKHILTQNIGAVAEWEGGQGYRPQEINLHGNLQRVFRLEPGDRFFMATDGVYLPMGSDELAQQLGQPGTVEELARGVMDGAQEGTDNRGLIVAQYSGPAAGLEESITAKEFIKRYGEQAKRMPIERQQDMAGFLSKEGLSLTDVVLDDTLPLYAQGVDLFEAVADRARRWIAEGIKFNVQMLPPAEWKEIGLIFKDPNIPGEPENNPQKRLPVYTLAPEDAPRLDVRAVLSRIFHDRLGIPESQGILVELFRDAEGKMHAVIFA